VKNSSLKGRLWVIAGFGAIYREPKGNEVDVLVDVWNPGSYEDVVELLVPEHQKGLMWSGYHVPDGTFRESLHNTSGKLHLGKGHLGYKYKWNKETVGSNVMKKR